MQQLIIILQRRWFFICTNLFLCNSGCSNWSKKHLSCPVLPPNLTHVRPKLHKVTKMNDSLYSNNKTILQAWVIQIWINNSRQALTDSPQGMNPDSHTGDPLAHWGAMLSPELAQHHLVTCLWLARAASCSKNFQTLALQDIMEWGCHQFHSHICSPISTTHTRSLRAICPETMLPFLSNLSGVSLLSGNPMLSVT